MTGASKSAPSDSDSATPDESEQTLVSAGAAQQTSQAHGQASPQIDPALLTELSTELDLSDPQSIVYFGSKAQRALSRVTRRMMKLAADAGPSRASRDLDAMLQVIRAFQPDAGSGWLSRLFGGHRRRLLRQVAEVVNQIDQSAAALERRKTELLTEVVAMDRLLDQCRQALHQVAHYEQAGRQALADVAQSSSAPASAADLLARCEDLSVSHVLAQQALATLLVGQRASRSLLTRVKAVLDQTLPAWQVHMAQLLSMWRGEQTVEMLDEVQDLRGEMAQMSQQLASARQAVKQALNSPKAAADVQALTVANEALSAAVGEGVALAREAATAVSQLKNVKQ